MFFVVVTTVEAVRAEFRKLTPGLIA
jgi:hypothetical protein